MSVLDRLTQEAHAVVEVAGVEWRVRGVHSSLVREGQSLLLALAAPSEEDIVQERMLASLPEESQAVARASWQLAQRARRLTPELAAKSAAQSDAVIMAAVLAARDVGTEAWERVELVAEGEPLVDGDPKRIPLDMLSAAARQEIFRVAWDVTTKGGAEAERLARFRGRRRDELAAREAVSDVRSPAA